MGSSYNSSSTLNRPLRVLMVNRADAHSVPGGDTVQMLRTRAGLECLGVQVEVSSAGALSHASEFDLIHVFNWQMLEPVLAGLPPAGPRPKIVLSTIFWYHTGHWFDEAARYKRVWKMARRAFGAVRARKFYERWQDWKFRSGEQGRNLRTLFEQVDQFLPNSRIELDHLEDLLGIPGRLRPRTTVVPNGIDRERYDPLPEPDAAFQQQYGLRSFILQVARIQSAKNQLGLIEALMDKTMPLVFIGQPSPYEPEYTARCEELGRQRGNVYFLGQRSPEAVAGISVLAGVHALPSWRETPGLASLEAAAAGCRIVTTAIGSTREYFGEDAWYCDPRDPRSIREAALAAWEAPVSGRLRQRILEQYTWEAAARATLQAYCKTLEKQKTIINS